MLAPKQQRFIEEYLIDLNGTQAAIRAGYSPKTANEQASRMLANVNIAAKVRETLEKRSDDLGIDQKYVLTTIKETVERCKQARPVLDKKGNPVMVETEDGTLAAAYVFDATNVLKGSELLGRHVGVKGFAKDVEQPQTNNNLFLIGDDNMLEAARRIAFVLARGAKAIESK